MIRLPDERIEHILKNHPDMNGQESRILETVGDPEVIMDGDYGELLAARFYAKTPLTSKHLVVAYREIASDGFILTAYFARRLSERRTILWKRSQ
jgi:hypothetical protein